MLLYEFQQFAVELMPVPVSIIHIFAARIKDTEITPEIPQRISDAIFRKNIGYIAKPGQKDIVRCFFPAAAFSAMNTDTFSDRFDPGLIKFFQLFAIEQLAVDSTRP